MPSLLSSFNVVLITLIIICQLTGWISHYSVEAIEEAGCLRGSSFILDESMEVVTILSDAVLVPLSRLNRKLEFLRGTPLSSENLETFALFLHCNLSPLDKLDAACPVTVNTTSISEVMQRIAQFDVVVLGIVLITANLPWRSYWRNVQTVFGAEV